MKGKFMNSNYKEWIKDILAFASIILFNFGLVMVLLALQTNP